jgi:hypothetical protein
VKFLDQPGLADRFGMKDRALRCETTHQVIQIESIDDHFSRCTVRAAGAIVPLW